MDEMKPVCFYTRWDAANAVRFLTGCYHEGVVDACELGSDADCERFVQLHRREIQLGNLKLDCQEYKDYMLYLLILCRKYRMYTFGLKFIEKYCQRITGRVFLYLCTMFYVQGVSDYLEYPNPLRMDEFSNIMNAFWIPNRAHKHWTTSDVMDKLQMFSFDMTVMVRSGSCEWAPRVTDRSVETFAKAMFALTRPPKPNMRRNDLIFEMDDNLVEADAAPVYREDPNGHRIEETVYITNSKFHE